MRFLWEDSHTGKPSSSKIWTHIAYSVSTYVIIKTADNEHWETLLIYMAVVGGSEIAKKILTLKFTGSSDTNTTPSSIDWSSPPDMDADTDTHTPTRKK